MSQIQQPARGEKFEAKDHLGNLLLFFPVELIAGMTTKFGAADAVSAHIVNLDKLGDDGQPLLISDGMVFSGPLVRQLKGALPENVVLGRLAQGANVNGNPPWYLMDHTDAELATGNAYLSTHPDPRTAPVKQPSAPPTSAVSAPTATAGASPPQTSPAWAAQVPPVTESALPVDAPTLQALLGKGFDVQTILGWGQSQAELILKTLS